MFDFRHPKPKTSFWRPGTNLMARNRCSIISPPRDVPFSDDNWLDWSRCFWQFPSGELEITTPSEMESRVILFRRGWAAVGVPVWVSIKLDSRIRSSIRRCAQTTRLIVTDGILSGSAWYVILLNKYWRQYVPTSQEISWEIPQIPFNFRRNFLEVSSNF